MKIAINLEKKNISLNLYHGVIIADIAFSAFITDVKCIVTDRIKSFIRIQYVHEDEDSSYL